MLFDNTYQMITIDNNNLTDEQLNIEEEKNILTSMLELNITK